MSPRLCCLRTYLCISRRNGAWTLTAVWAPVPSEDIVPLLDVADPGVLGALEDLGLSVVRARIELAR